MARNAAPEDGAETGPEERTPSRGLGGPGAEDPSDANAPGLDRGEPSWPEDPDALRAEALSEGGTGLTPLAEPSVAGGERLPPPGSDATVQDGTSGLPEAVPDAGSPSADEPWTAPGNQPSPLVGLADEGEASPPVRDDGAPEPFAAEGSVPPREPVAEGSRPAAPGPEPRRRGAGALLLGGMIAAALGFGAAWLAQDRLGGPRLPDDLDDRLAVLEARPRPDSGEVQALAERFADVEARVTALEEITAPPAEPAPAPVDLEPLRQEVAAGLDRAEERATDLEERLAALEARPSLPDRPSPGALSGEAGPALRVGPDPDAPDAAEAIAALEPRLTGAEAALAEVQAALNDTEATLTAVEGRVEGLDGRVESNDSALAALDSRLGEIDAGLDDAASRLDRAESRLEEAAAAGASALEEARSAAASLEEARSRASAAEAEARREAAIAALDSALDAGQPFEDALRALDLEVPDALAQAASEGLPSLAALRESFPGAARAGLAAAREDDLVEERGVAGFLFDQFSVRSTAPRAGDDPDAVLSRAEAALAQGRLGEALSEIGSLPEPVQAAMADWIAQARARAEAEAALESLRAGEPAAAPAD